MQKKIYADHAATTALRQDVLQEMLPYFTENFGNSSSIHEMGRQAGKAAEKARAQIAAALNAQPSEIYFTAGGTESDNWAIKGILEAYAKKGRHVITSKIEHPAVLHTCQHLEKQGFHVSYIDVDEDGIIDLDALEKAIRPDTVLISVMYANNEIGTIQPVKEIAKIAKAHGVLFHTDAVQAAGHIPLDVVADGVDLLSLSAHKFYGPKGIGALYIRNGVRIAKYMDGGEHEKSRRAGTLNTPAIVGMGKAIEFATQNMERGAGHLEEMRDALIQRIEQAIPFCRLNGHRTQRLPGNVNFSFQFIEGESLLMYLDMKGIYASTGSACSSASLDASHVLLAIGLQHEEAHGSLRLTLGEENTMEDVEEIMRVLPGIIDKLRQMSPLYETILTQ